MGAMEASFNLLWVPKEKVEIHMLFHFFIHLLYLLIPVGHSLYPLTYNIYEAVNKPVLCFCKCFIKFAAKVK